MRRGHMVTRCIFDLDACVEDQWYTTRQVSKGYHLTPDRVRRFIRAGQLPAYDLGRGTGYRIPKSGIIAWLKSPKSIKVPTPYNSEVWTAINRLEGDE